MNIFYLDTDPKLAAQYHCDKHCSKMLIEYAQLMSSAHRETNSPHADLCYKTTHINHPSNIWTRASQDHYTWLWDCWHSLSNEFYKRRGKYHASWVKLGHILCYNPPGLPCAGFTQPPQCMPECYHQEDAVEAYRDYYRHEKSKFAQWNWGTPAPDWYSVPKEHPGLMV